MAAPTLEIEVRWRPTGSTMPWNVQRFPPTAGVITLTGLQRGVAYEGHARSLGPGDSASDWVPITFVVASESSTPLDKLTLDLDIEAGIVVVDCTMSKFRLTLNANVTGWVFANVPPATTITIEIVQWAPGNHTIAWPASVSPVTGTPHVMSATVGAVNLVTLQTTNGGAKWYQTVGAPTPSGSNTQAFGITLSPSPATGTSTTNGTTPSAPSRQVTAAPANGVAPITYAWDRADTDGGAAFTISSAVVSNPTFSIPPGTAAYNATQVWRCTAKDANGKVAQESVSITLNRALTGGLTVAISPSPAHATGATNPTATVHADASSGSGPRRYAWTRIDSAGGTTFGCSAPTEATTSFAMRAGETPLTRVQTWRCTVQDDQSSVFADVQVTLERLGV